MYHARLNVRLLLEIVGGDLRWWASSLDHRAGRKLPLLADAVDANDDRDDRKQDAADDNSDDYADTNVDRFLSVLI